MSKLVKTDRAHLSKGFFPHGEKITSIGGKGLEIKVKRIEVYNERNVKDLEAIQLE